MIGQPTIDKAYQASSVIRTCQRALGDEAQPFGPGDLHSIGLTLEMAGGLIGDVLEAMERARMGNSRSEGLAEKFAEWRAVVAQKAALVDANGGNDPEHNAAFDTLCVQEEKLAQAITTTQPKSPTDAAAVLEWVTADSCGIAGDSKHAAGTSAVLRFLKGAA